MKKLWVENISNAAILYQEDNPGEGWSDCDNSLESWHTYWKRLNDIARKDYLFCKDKMHAICDNLGGWGSLSLPQKLICCEHRIYEQSDWLTIIDMNTVVMFDLQYKSRTKDVMPVRMAFAEGVIKLNFTEAQVQSILPDARGSIIDFVLFNVKGTPKDSIDSGIINYIYGTGAYFDNGLLQKDWTPSTGMTIQQVCDQLYDILINGNY